MASADAIASFRRLIGELDDAEPYTDSVLSSLLDATTDTRALAATIWDEKASSLAVLVDVREGNSDRKLSQLHKHALEMAAHYGSASETASANRRGTRTRKIERQ